MRLEAFIGVDNEEPRLAVGSCSRTLLESLGYDPTFFREQGHLVTSWRWQKTHDGYRSDSPIEEPKKAKRLGSKTAQKLDARWAAWSKDQ